MTNIKYRAFVDSARSEYNLLVQNHHARVISRIGFVAQDMKDFQIEVFNAIQNRAIEINNNNAACLLEAERNLQSSAVEAGNVIVHAAKEWRNELSFINDEFATPLLDDIELVMSIMQKEHFYIFAYVNPVTELQAAVMYLTIEAEILKFLFELFVSEAYSDFLVFVMLTNMKSEELFPLLDTALDDFRVSGNLIINSLANCSG